MRNCLQLLEQVAFDCFSLAFAVARFLTTVTGAAAIDSN